MSFKAIHGSKLFVKGVELVAVPLRDILIPNIHELSPNRLTNLREGYDSLEKILKDPYWYGDPITLEKSNNTGHYKVNDGRHRTYLASRKEVEGLECIWAKIS